MGRIRLGAIKIASCFNASRAGGLRKFRKWMNLNSSFRLLTSASLRISHFYLFSNIRKMSLKTIAVLDEAELKDGQMYPFSFRYSLRIT